MSRDTETTSNFPRLYSALNIAGVTLPNRIVSSGHDTMMAENGRVSDRLIAYHTARARGGAGLIVLQVSGVHPTARYTSHMLMADSDDVTDDLTRLATAVHAYPTRLFAQLFHPGREVLDRDEGRLRVACAPSSVPNERARVIPRALTTAEVEEIIESYARAAARFAAAGFDGVEITASHGYLPAQFLNPNVNHRTDRFGPDHGSDFLVEIFRYCKRLVPRGFAVGLRISIDERDPFGLDPDIALTAVDALVENDLMDYLNVTTGSSATLAGSDHIAPDMSFDPGYLAADLTRHHFDPRSLPIPVILAGRINQPQEAERLLGVFDAVVMTRALICDPDLPRKATVAPSSIRSCIACNQACIGHFHQGVPISCIQNPSSGRELWIRPKHRSRGLALVVGAGPAGLSSALTLDAAGYEVKVVEANSYPGGAAALSKYLPGREEFAGLVDNQLVELNSRNINVDLNHPLSPTDLTGELSLVVLATGSTSYLPDLEQMGCPRLYTERSLLVPHIDVSFSNANALVVDADASWVAPGLARRLSAHNTRVTLVTSAISPGDALQQYVRDSTIKSLYEARVNVIPLTRLFGLDDDSAYLENVLTGEKVILGDIDFTVFVGYRRANSLADLVAAAKIPFLEIGDALSPRTAEEAIFEGWHNLGVFIDSLD